MERVEDGGDGDGDSSTCLIGVDATPSPGLKRLFNFFGFSHAKRWGERKREEEDSDCFNELFQASLVSELLAESERVCNQTVVFGHYPAALFPQPAIR